ncbi:GNAT family protein [Ectobacillus antri]|jgi:RimJ/RimL family protein N-acetyltransferase|uniref:GNAT family protein n=1 Tax=Ectobacillus antri TaxID=2486280 RepID=A0ABT6H688_9BACI|nr:MULTISPECIES: GNAT family protein [Ectobacillus]MDG4656913.1 GNAT family protein [Ectobacillus antri]MDG5754190.1 GNAT family protein [Ectobacillus antri]UOY93286.1 GNAT family N-acetyltransferase [Ectobacillus sp. JY-23]
MITDNIFEGTYVRLGMARSEDVEVMAKWGESSVYLRHVDTDIAFPGGREFTGGLKSNSVSFRLRSKETDMLVGFVALHGIEWNNRTGLLAIGIGEEHLRNKGYGTDALQLILRYAFYELNLDRVGLDVISYNQRAIRTYEKVGFIVEGAMRSAVYRDGKRYDRIIMGILKSEWEAKLTNTMHKI